MWLFTTKGFISAVCDRDRPGYMLVRARKEADLQDFLEQVRSGRKITVACTPAADYRWRATISRAQFQRALSNLAGAMDYDNFKGGVHGRDAQLDRILGILGSLWQQLRNWQQQS